MVFSPQEDDNEMDCAYRNESIQSDMNALSIYMDVLVKRKKITCTLPNFISIMTTKSNLKKTVEIYELIPELVKTIRPDIKMKTYRTAQDIIWTHLRHVCLPRSVRVDLQHP